MRQMSCLKTKHKASENEEHTTPNLNPTWSNYITNSSHNYNIVHHSKKKKTTTNIIIVHCLFDSQ